MMDKDKQVDEIIELITDVVIKYITDSANKMNEDKVA